MDKKLPHLIALFLCSILISFTGLMGSVKLNLLPLPNLLSCS